MTRPLFNNKKVGSMWLEGKSEFSDSHALITISNSSGEHSLVITPEEVRPAKASDYVSAPAERVATPAKQRKRKIGAIITLAGYAVAVVLAIFIGLAGTGTIQARVVLTGSMEPTINPGDVVILQPHLTTPPNVGDIVTYTGRRFDGTPVSAFTHRIIAGDSVKGYVLKGDANPNPDTQQVKLNDIVGKVIFRIPFIGKLLIPKNLVTIIPLLFVLWLIVDRWRND